MSKEKTTTLPSNQGEIILYQPDETIRIDVRVENDTVWLTQAQMAELFGTHRQAITKHLKNIYESKELRFDATSSILELVQKEGVRYVKRKIELYNLDVIISVGYRVNTQRGIQFRQWAICTLKEHILKQNSLVNRIEHLEQRVYNNEQQIDFFVRTSLPPVEGVFFENQIFDAYVFVSKLIKSAKESIVLIDNYIDESVLTLLDKRETIIPATIFTQRISSQLQLDISRHNAQYQPIEAKIYKKAHDRFLIIDNDIYHIGASVKDLGKKLFAFAKIYELAKEELLERMR